MFNPWGKLVLVFILRKYFPWLLFWDEFVFCRIHSSLCTTLLPQPVSTAWTKGCVWDSRYQQIQTTWGGKNSPLKLSGGFHSRSTPHQPQPVMFSHSSTCLVSPGPLTLAPPSSFPPQGLHTCYSFFSAFSHHTISTPFCITNSCSPFKCQLKYDVPNPRD